MWQWQPRRPQRTVAGAVAVGWLCPRRGYYLPDEPWAEEGYREATPEEVVAGREERAADRRMGQRALGH